MDSPVVPVEDALYILFLLTYPLTKVSVPRRFGHFFVFLTHLASMTQRPDLEAKLGLEHLYCFTLIHSGDVHVGPLKRWSL